MNSTRGRLTAWLQIVLTFVGPVGFAPFGLSVAHAAVSPNFVYQGVFLDAAGTAPMTGTVDLLLGIYDPSGNCMLYEEEHIGLNLTASNGSFSVRLGSGLETAASSARGYSMIQVFSNSQVTAVAAPACAPGYSPAATDGRSLHVEIKNPTVTGSYVALTPNQSIESAPTAIVAQTLQGYVPTDFMQSSATNNVTNSNLASNSVDSSKIQDGTVTTNDIADLTITNIDIANGTINPTTKLDNGVCANGEVLKKVAGAWACAPDTSGVATVTAAATAGNPITIGGTATNPTVDITAASGVSNGYLSASNFLAFNNKQTGTLTNGRIWVGTAGNVTAELAGGATDDVLKWNGTSWVAGPINGGTLTGATFTNGSITGSTTINTSGSISTSSTVTGGNLNTTGNVTLTGAGSTITNSTASPVTIADDLSVTGNASISGTVTSGGLSTAAGYLSTPVGVGAGQAGRIDFRELVAGGTNTVGFRAPDAIAANVIWTLPATDGTSGYALTTNGAGQLQWTAMSGGSIGGSGTTNAIPKFTAGTSLGDSAISENGFQVTSTLPLVLTGGSSNLSVGGVATINGSMIVMPNAVTTINASNAAASLDLQTNSVTRMAITTGAINLNLGTVINGGNSLTVSGNVAANGGNVNSSAATFNIASTNVNGTVNLTATGTGNVNIGTGSGSINLQDQTSVTGTLQVSGNIYANSGTITTLGGALNVTSQINNNMTLASAGTGATVINSGSGGIQFGNPVTSGSTITSTGFVGSPSGVAAGQTGRIDFRELAAGGTNTVGFRAPDAIGSDVTWTLPAADGTSGYALTTNGAGQLQWTAMSGGSMGGTGTANRMAKFTGASAIGDSSITDTGALVTIANPTDITGNVGVTGSVDVTNYYRQGGTTILNTATGVTNLFVGRSAGTLTSANIGTNNVAVGTNALDSTTGAGASDNVAIGHNAGTAITTASTSVIVGSQAGRTVTTSGANAFVGHEAGRDTTGSGNTMLGYQAGVASGTVGNATYIGKMAGQIATGPGNTLIGSESGRSIAGAQNNTMVGAFTAINATGSNNTIMGNSAGAAIVAGAGNIILGSNAGPTANQSNRLYINNSQSDTPLIGGDFTTGRVYMSEICDESGGNCKDISTGWAGGMGGSGTTNRIPMFTAASTLGDSPIYHSGARIGIGAAPTTDALEVTGAINSTTYYKQNGFTVINTGTGTSNAFFGRTVGNTSLTGSTNVAIGASSGSLLSTGSQNTFVGVGAGSAVTTGSSNLLIGANAGSSIVGGPNNILLGVGTGASIVSGGGNVMLGNGSGASTTGSGNVFMGHAAGAAITAGASNIAIGSNAGPTTNQSNKLFIHNSQTDSPLLGGDFSTLLADVNGDLRIRGVGGVAKSLQIFDSDNTQSITIRTPATGTLTTSYSLTLPANDGGSGEVLSTDGSGNLSWIAAGGSISSDANNNTKAGTGAAPSVIGSRNTAFGRDTGLSLSSGADNTFYGFDAGRLTTIGGLNTAVGVGAGRANVSNSNGTFFGANAGYSSAADYNTMIGSSAGEFATSGGYNTFLGVWAGKGLNAGTPNTGTGNVAVGYLAGQRITSGMRSVFMGYRAGDAMTSSSDNVFIGHQSGISMVTGQQNVMLGTDAGYSANGNNSTVYVGYRAGQNSTGSSSVFVGHQAGRDNTGSGHVAIGQSAGLANNTNGNGVFIGTSAGQNNTGAFNVAIGQSAGSAGTGGANTYVGYNAGTSISSGSNGTMIGYGAGTNHINGTQNTFVGADAGRGAGAGSTGIDNVSIGFQSGYSLAAGQANVLVGQQAGFSVAGGSRNILIGSNAGRSIATGSYNVVVGDYAAFNMTGGNNSYIGGAAGRFATTASSTTAVGYEAGRGTSVGSPATGSSNSYFGYQAGMNVQTPNLNTFLGASSGTNTTTGGWNVFVGSNTGRSNLVGDSNTFLGESAGYSSVGSGNVFLGHQAGYNETGSNKLYIDNSNTATPLIAGDFSANTVTINGTLTATGGVAVMTGYSDTQTTTSSGTLYSNYVALPSPSIGDLYEFFVLCDSTNATGESRYARGTCFINEAGTPYCVKDIESNIAGTGFTAVTAPQISGNTVRAGCTNIMGGPTARTRIKVAKILEN